LARVNNPARGDYEKKERESVEEDHEAFKLDVIKAARDREKEGGRKERNKADAFARKTC